MLQQREVSLVQCAHGWHKANGISQQALLLQMVPQRGFFPENQHKRSGQNALNGGKHTLIGGLFLE
jgi:hypothetical protein